MTEKSIAQIVAEIKAKVHKFNAQLNAIQVDELPEELDGWWEIASNSSKRLTMLIGEMLDDYTDDKEAVRVILFELRRPLESVLVALDGLTYFATQFQDFSAVFSSDDLSKIHSVLADAQWIRGNYDQLAKWYQSQ